MSIENWNKYWFETFQCRILTVLSEIPEKSTLERCSALIVLPYITTYIKKTRFCSSQLLDASDLVCWIWSHYFPRNYVWECPARSPHWIVGLQFAWMVKLPCYLALLFFENSFVSDLIIPLQCLLDNEKYDNYFSSWSPKVSRRWQTFNKHVILQNMTRFEQQTKKDSIYRQMYRETVTTEPNSKAQIYNRNISNLKAWAAFDKVTFCTDRLKGKKGPTEPI